MIIRWSKIASFLPGRTDNEIKNVWNTHLKKRLTPSSSSSSLSSTHDQSTKADHDKNCDGAQEEIHSGLNESQNSATSSHHQGECMHTKPELHEVNGLNEIQFLLDHDDFDDITSEFLQDNDILFPLDSLLHNHQTHISTQEMTREVTKSQSFDHPQPDIPCGFEDTNEESDLRRQLVESTTPNNEYDEWFNFIDNQTYFDDFNFVGEVCL